MLAREEVGITASRVIQQEAESSSTLIPHFSIETLDNLQHGPYNQAEKDGVTGVSRKNKEAHGNEKIIASLERCHVGIE
jgi:hypothetical protein